MHFVHRGYEVNRTIAAVATAAGDAGIAVIRISGSKALEVADAIFSKDVFSFASHTAHYGKILSSSLETIDQVLLLVMKAPRSFTGEDVVEIHCHGGFLITQKVLQRVFEAGALPAQAGEFSFKAFMHGKLDLTQAEAIQALIHAKNQASLKAAQHHLEGRLKEEIHSLKSTLTDIAAIFEAWVDYPEEGLEFASHEEIYEQLFAAYKKIENLLLTYQDGQKLSRHIKLSLLGAPNAGKSSLLNRLCGKERAIVTEIAGTTRDTLETEIHLGSFSYQLTDTAGIRDTDEIIEQEGIKRSFKAALEADLVLVVCDAKEKVDDSLLQNLRFENTLIVWNKIDLLPQIDLPSHPRFDQVWISAKENIGCDKLKEKIESKIKKAQHLSKESVLLTSERHFQALHEASRLISVSLEGLKSHLSPEFILIDLREALVCLGSIIGTNVSEDILSAIFSKFCVGK